MRKPSHLAAVALFLVAVWTRPAPAQLTVKPTDGRLLGFAAAPEPGKWIVIAAAEFLPIPCTVLENGKAIVFEGPPGKYGIFFFPPGDGQPVVQVIALGPVVPKPDPPVPPPGTRWGVIWEQTEQRTPAQAALYIELRKKLARDRLLILDVDGLPPDWEALRKTAVTQKLPALSVAADKRILRTIPLPNSVDSVLKELAK